MKKIIIVSILIITALIFMLESKEYSTYRMQEEISENIIRFHIRANSDLEEDQQMKLFVKEKTVKYMEELLKNSESLDESRDILNTNMDSILAVAENAVKEYGGENYSVSGYIGNEYFPVKKYGDLTFPPGEYEAFVINIGEGEGSNWWCVLYPPLCFVDAIHSEVPQDSKDLLRASLGSSAYNMITGNTGEISIKYHFRYLTFLNKWLGFE